MAILLNILKIIGIVLLVILAVLLVLLLLMLFVPVVYKAEGEKQEKLHAKARFSWLFPLIYGKVGYDEEKEQKLSCIFYILGIPVYDAFAEKKPKKEKKQKPDKKSVKAKKKKAESKKEPAKKAEPKQAENKKPENNKSENNHIENNQIENKQIENKLSDGSHLENKQSESRQESKQTDTSLSKNIAIEELDNVEKTESTKKPNFFEKIKLFFEKLFEKIKNIKYTVLNIANKFKNLKENICWYLEVLEREESKLAISKCKTKLGRFFKHLKPKKLRGNILFGFEDPGTTGEVLAYISMFYPVYGNYINIVPVFNEDVFKGDFYIKGRIRVFTAIQIGFSIFFDKDIRNLYNILTGGMNNE